MAAQAVDTTNLKEDIKKKPGPNNLEEATRFVQEVDKAVQKFTDTVHEVTLWELLPLVYQLLLLDSRAKPALPMLTMYYLSATVQCVNV